MKRKRNRRFAALLLCCLCIPLFCTGCAEELYKRMIITGIGVDYGEGRYRVSVRVETPSNGSEKVVTSEGETVYDALNSLSLKSGSTQMYSHSYYVVFGDSAVERGLDDCIDFFVRYFQSSPDIALLAAEGSAEELLNTQEGGEMVPSEDIKNFTQSEKNSGKVMKTDLITFVSASQNFGRTALMPVVSCKDEVLTLNGTCLFLDYKKQGLLTREENMGYLAVKGRLKTGVMVVEDEEFGDITVEFTSVEPKTELSMPPTEVHIYIRAECNLASVTTRFPQTKEEFDRVEGLIGAELQKRIEDCAETSYSRGCDVFSVGYQIYREQTDAWRGMEQNWPELAKNLKFQVKTQVRVNRIGEEKRPRD